MNDDRKSTFRDAVADKVTARHVPDTPQTRAPAYRLAFADDEFLLRDELRPVRLQLELLKPQLMLDEHGIESTVVLFGGARIPEPSKKSTARTKALADLSHYYDEARTFARLMTEKSLATDCRQHVVATGGGPGV
ncbi:MAG: lysine decarboxylase, partial [Rhodobacteraceae bacterium]|nr:lysine decarboxylase [Paracoccaceae bacterium]